MSDTPSNERVPLSLEALGNDQGKTLLEAAAKEFARIEDSIQAHLDEHIGSPPTKPYKLLVEVTVLAKGEELREVGWTVQAKMPAVTQDGLQHAESRDGQIITRKPRKLQETLDLQRPDPSHDESAE